jgi:hypothetical protein
MRNRINKVKSTTPPSRFINIVLHCTANRCKQIAAVFDSHQSSSIDKSPFELTYLKVSFVF